MFSVVFLHCRYRNGKRLSGNSRVFLYFWKFQHSYTALGFSADPDRANGEQIGTEMYFVKEKETAIFPINI